MVDLSKVSQAVQKFVADVAKTEGDKKKVDTPHEYDKLANYLANNQNNLNANEKDFIDGYMLEFTTKQKADVKNQEQGGDSVKKSANDSEPSTISGENESWQTIIKKYYPDLLKDGGNLHDAIRTLQKALCTDENGVVDETKLKNLRLSASLPEKIKLPSELNGVKKSDYITISGENEGWQTIIKKHYPGLLKDGGNLHDAIRTLQKALCTDENGVVDETKLKNLRHSTSLPKEIKLPLELNGAKFQIVEGEVKNDYFVDDLY